MEYSLAPAKSKSRFMKKQQWENLILLFNRGSYDIYLQARIKKRLPDEHPTTILHGGE
jgi:hypothetical protein